MGPADRMDMDTEGTADVMRLLAAVGERMGSDWRALTGEIDGMTGQLGRGVLGAAFLDGYTSPAAETARIVEACCREPGRFADTGNRCVTEYVSADGLSRDALNSVDPITASRDARSH